MAGPGAATPPHADQPERQPQPVTQPGVIDYGRYAGWSIDELANHDLDFLEWLLRMPAGRPYATQIREVLARREGQRVDMAPKPVPRRSLFGLRTAGAR